MIPKIENLKKDYAFKDWKKRHSKKLGIVNSQNSKMKLHYKRRNYEVLSAIQATFKGKI